MNVKAGHFLHGEDYTRFDAPFFNISPNEAKVGLDLTIDFGSRLINAGNGSKSSDAP